MTQKESKHGEKIFTIPEMVSLGYGKRRKIDKMLYIANKKTGKKICVVDDRDKGLELIRILIANDKDHEHFEEREYDVVDYNGTSMV